MGRLFNYIKRGVQYIISGQPQQHTTANIISVNPTNIHQGKRILITGGSRGIGYAIAKKLVSEGATVMITGRNEETLKKVSEELNCRYLCMDISDTSNISFLFERADEEIGGFDCLVNNAGVSLHERCFEEVTQEQFDTQFDTNLKGGYFLTQCFVNTCKREERKNCKIIFISSQRGTFVDDIPYGLTKVAINSLVQALAYDLIKYDIRVYGLAPGATLTDLFGEGSKDNIYYEVNRSKRFYLPEEVAEVANFLLMDIANCLSGNILVCDEGRSINTYKKF